MSTRKLRKIIIAAYLEWLGTEIPNLLQIVTFMAFLALVIKAAPVIGVLIAILFTLYLTSVRERKIDTIVQHINFHNPHGKASKNEISQIVRTTVVLDLTISFLAGALMMLLALEVVKLVK